MLPTSALLERFQGRSVDLLGNGPSVTAWQPEGENARAVVTVNAGLKYLAQVGGHADLLWLQDERFLVNKAEALLLYRDKVDMVGISNAIAPQVPTDLKSRTLSLPMLGYQGFSYYPPLGLFHGYNVIYGALQLLAWCDIRELKVYGVGLDYWSMSPRFDQTQRGGDVDLHRAADQVYWIRHGISVLESQGVPVEVIGDSFLNRSAIPEPAQPHRVLRRSR